MILVDTNVIIDFWDKPTEEVKNILEENDIAICGVIKQKFSVEVIQKSSSHKWKRL